MNVQKLKKCLEYLEKEMGDGLIAASIVDASDSQIIVATEKSSPAAATLANEIVHLVNSSLARGGYPELGKYIIMDLIYGKRIIIITLGDYQCGMAINADKSKMGLFLNITLPGFINVFEEAISALP